MISSDALLHYVQQEPFNLAVRVGDRVQLILSIAFDACSCVIFSTLCNGGTLFLSSTTTFLEDCKHCTILPTTPSLLRTLQDPGQFPNVRSVFLGGEPPDEQLVKRWDTSQRKIYNSYGATETTCTSLIAELHVNQPITLGNPISGSGILILNERLEDCDEGELAISGKGLAIGYFADDANTRQRFIQWNQRRVYLTGDLVKRTNHGLIYLGRKDSLVKNRGYLIHIEEVISSIRTHPKVEDADAFMHRNRLVTFVTPGTVDATEVRTWLATRCDAYAIPDDIRSIECLPLTANGKIDTAALRKNFEKKDVSRDYIPTSQETGVLNILKRAISKTLDVRMEQIRTDRTFWELGGNSLAAIELLSHLHKSNLVLTMGQLFGSTTVDGLGIVLETFSSPDRLDINTDTTIVKDINVSITSQQSSMIRSSLQTPPLAHIFVRICIKHGEKLFNEKAFENAWRSALKGHSVFASHIDLSNGTQTFDNATFDWNVIHVAKTGSYRMSLERVQQQAFEDSIQAPASEIFVPRNSFRLVKCSGRESTLFWAVHHALIDGRSVGVIMDDVEAALNQQRTNTIPSFELYTLALERSIVGTRKESVQFWQQLLHPIIGRTQLLKTYSSDTLRITPLRTFDSICLGISRVELMQRSRDLSVSHAAIIYAAWALLLSNYTSSQQVAFGAIMSGRTLPMADIDRVVEPLINTCPFPVNLEDYKTGLTLLRGVQDTHVAISDFQWGVESNVGKVLSIDGSPFDTVVAIEFDMPASTQKINLAGFECNISRTDFPEFKLTLFIEHGNDGMLAARAVYDPSMFSATIVKRMLGHFRHLIYVCLTTDDTQQSMEALGEKMMTQHEVKKLITVQSSQVLATPNTNVIDTFNITCQIYSDEIALDASQNLMSYADLGHKTNLVANALLPRLKTGNVVAVLSDSSYEWVIAMLGILRAGAVYAPIDIALPQSRKEYMLKQSKSSICITVGDTMDTGYLFGIPLISVQSLISSGSPGTSLPLISPDHNAYLIFTSGSTGVPKPVACTHRALNSYLSNPTARLFARPGRRHAQMYSVGFDVSIAEVLGALCFGATLVLKRREDPYAHLNKVNAAMFTPSFLSTWDPDALGDLDTVMLAGEVTSQGLADKWSTKVRLYNGYGPCECNIISTIKLLQHGDRVTVGSPVPGMKVYILNQRMKPVPFGIPGEICISGIQVANGYFGQHEQSPKFMNDPFDKTRQMYCTGDLGAWTQNSEIMFLGRMDNQVKIRGFRVELEEVEAAIKAADPKIKLAGAVLSEDGQCLFGAFSPSSFDVMAIKKYLHSTLPLHAIPGKIVGFDSIPITPNQKLDRSALRMLVYDYQKSQQNLRENYRMAETELIVADAFKEVLGLRKETALHSNDNFMELGGHSLRQLRLAQCLSQRLSFRVPMMLILKNGTISDLAEAISQYLQIHQQTKSFLSDISNLGETKDLSPLEAELYTLHQSSPVPSAFNLGVEIYFEGEVDANIVASATDYVLQRHTIFKTQYFVSENSSHPQRRLSTRSLEVKRLNPMLRGTLNTQGSISEPLDLARDLPLRAELVDDSWRVVLLFKMHHIIFDKDSIGILLREILQTYLHMSDLIGVEDIVIPVKPSQYSTWASWISTHHSPISLQARKFWTCTLSSIPALPFSTSQTQYGECGDSIHFSVPLLDTQASLTLVLAATSLAIHAMRGTDDLVIAVSHTDRSEPGTEDIIGCFLDRLLVRILLDPDTLSSRSSLFEHIQSRLSDTFSHLLPYSVIRQVVGKSNEPLFDVMVSFHRQEEQSTEKRAMKDKGVEVSTKMIRDESAALFPLLIEAFEKDGEMEFCILYKPDVIKKAEIEILRSLLYECSSIR